MGTTKPTLSVAVITYNQEGLLGATLDSILSQKHDYPYEIVIGDDSSRDGTRDVIEGYRTRYPGTIKAILNERNLGITGNYYNVIRHCMGDYVMQCAGDDFWLPGKVALQLAFMEANPGIGMCYTKARNVFDNKRILDDATWGGRSVSFDALLERNTVPAVTMAFRSDALKSFLAEVRPDERPWPIEDYPEVLWFALRSRIGFIDSCTAAYRVVSDSAVHTKDFSKIEKLNLATRDIKRFYIAMADGKADKDALVRADDALYRSYLSHYLRDDRELALHYYRKIAEPTFKDKIKYSMCRFPWLHTLSIRLAKTLKS